MIEIPVDHSASVWYKGASSGLASKEYTLIVCFWMSSAIVHLEPLPEGQGVTFCKGSQSISFFSSSVQRNDKTFDET